MISSLRSRWERVPADRRRIIADSLRATIVLAIVVFLVVRISQLGWRAVLDGLPRTPWFYLIFLIMYFTLPVTEAVAYGLIWRRSPWQLLPATLRKRVYNRDVAGLTGEISLYFWARRAVDGASSRVFHGLKDNTIVASLTSVGFATAVLVVLLASGAIALPPRIAGHQLELSVGILLMGGALVALAVRYRRTILVLSRRMLLALGTLHLSRLVVVHVLQIALWAVVIPGVELRVWLTFLAMQIIVARLPIIPGRDLVFAGVGIEMSRGLAMPEPAIASLLIATSALDRLLNLAVFAVASWVDRPGRSSATSPGTDPEQATPPPSG